MSASTSTAHEHVTPNNSQKPTTAKINATNTAQNNRNRLYNTCMLRLPDHPGELTVDTHHVTHRQATNRETVTIHRETDTELIRITATSGQLELRTETVPAGLGIKH